MDKPINATAAAMLGLLHERPMSGWDLNQVSAERLGNFWRLTPSQVYRELDSLADAGLVVAEQRESRERQPYRLTDRGREAFRHWLTASPGRESIRYPLLLTMAFAEHLSQAELGSLLHEQREIHRERLERYRDREREITALTDDPYALATLRFGILHEQATLAWFEELDVLAAEQDRNS